MHQAVGKNVDRKKAVPDFTQWSANTTAGVAPTAVNSGMYLKPGQHVLRQLICRVQLRSRSRWKSAFHIRTRGATRRPAQCR